MLGTNGPKPCNVLRPSPEFERFVTCIAQLRNLPRGVNKVRVVNFTMRGLSLYAIPKGTMMPFRGFLPTRCESRKFWFLAPKSGGPFLLAVAHGVDALLHQLLLSRAKPPFFFQAIPDQTMVIYWTTCMLSLSFGGTRINELVTADPINERAIRRGLFSLWMGFIDRSQMLVFTR